MTDNRKPPAELLPCWFCGAEPKLTERGGAAGYSCRAVLPHSHLVQSYGKTEAEAREAWNTRATLPSQDRSGDARELPPMPACDERRPHDIEGFMESESDWLRRNPQAVCWLADNHATIRAALASSPDRSAADEKLVEMPPEIREVCNDLLSGGKPIGSAADEVERAFKEAYELGFLEGYEIEPRCDLADREERTRALLAMEGQIEAWSDYAASLPTSGSAADGWVPKLRALADTLDSLIIVDGGPDRVHLPSGTCMEGEGATAYLELVRLVRDGLREALAAAPKAPSPAVVEDELCDDCPPVGYPTDKTRCLPCPRRADPSAIRAQAFGVEEIEQVISAWAFAHDVDGAARNDLFKRIRALSPTPATPDSFRCIGCKRTFAEELDRCPVCKLDTIRAISCLPSATSLDRDVLKELVEALIRKWERGQNHDEGAFDPDCETCLLLADLRAALLKAQQGEGQ